VLDSHRHPVLRDDQGGVLVPAEGLLSVTEVKSTLTLAEIRKSLAIARTVRNLRPFGGNFVGAAQKGHQLPVGSYRCLFTVFAYKSNLRESDWLDAEWARYKGALGQPGEADLIDRIVVLDRGLINPPFATGKQAQDEKRVLHEWFINVANFLARENDRRPAMDWQVYADKYSPGWSKLV